MFVKMLTMMPSLRAFLLVFILFAFAAEGCSSGKGMEWNLKIIQGLKFMLQFLWQLPFSSHVRKQVFLLVFQDQSV